MSELLATLSGAGKVVTAGYNFGTDRKYEVLSDVFVKEVLKTPIWVWYVDHATVDAAQFNVRYLTQDPQLSWTNENLNQRVPEIQWTPPEVAEWFVGHKHVVRFVTRDGARHTLTLEAFKCDIDGQSEGVWERYVDQGVRGALEPFLSEFARLEAIEVHAV